MEIENSSLLQEECDDESHFDAKVLSVCNPTQAASGTQKHIEFFRSALNLTYSNQDRE